MGRACVGVLSAVVPCHGDDATTLGCQGGCHEPRCRVPARGSARERTWTRPASKPGSRAAGSRLGPVWSGVPGSDRRAGARSLLWLGEAVECRSHHGRGCGSEDGAEHHIARIVHAGVDARVGHPSRKQPDRQAQPRQVPADGVGERERRRGMPGGKRGRSRHRYLAGRELPEFGAVRTPPPGKGLHAEVDGRRGHADRDHALQRRPTPPPAADQRDGGGDAQPQARGVGGVRQPADGPVQLRGGGAGHRLLHRPVDGPQLPERLRPAGCRPPAGFNSPRQRVCDGLLLAAGLLCHAEIVGSTRRSQVQSVSPTRRLSAIVALVAVVAVLAVAVVGLLQRPLALLVALACLGVAIAAAAYALTRTGARRLLAAVVAVLALAAPLALVVAYGRLLQLLLLVALVAVVAVATRHALGRDLTSLKSGPTPGTIVGPAVRPVLLMNPRSGGGKVERFNLVEEARRRGIEPVVLAPGDDLLRLAERAGADVVGMAGGDGSQALVASVAAAHDVGFVCVPAGTRNHLAMDLGLDREDVVGALDAFGEA